ncbi:MAG: tetratricopeptide repeat protein [Candidatus Zixiibacteriota bacterium]
MATVRNTESCPPWSFSRPPRWRTRALAALCVAIGLMVGFPGCVYFNTYYNARSLFNTAEKQYRKDSHRGRQLSPSTQAYQDAITKAAKIVQKHPKSKYHDDALFLIGVSYFRMESYSKSENAFRELLATHPKSNLTEESELYLARCRMLMDDEQSAFRAFTQLATTARKPAWRAEAIFQRGLYFLKSGSADSAVAAFQVVLDEYSGTDRALEARLRAAEALRQVRRPREAIALYEPLAQEKNGEHRYEALTGIGLSWYEAEIPDSGIAIFSDMAEDDAYADSIGPIRLNLARGLRNIGDREGAQRQYEQVTATKETTPWSAEACFRLAEILQFEENDLLGAKDLYEKSRQEYSRGDLANLALTRSANITKLEQFRKELGRAELSKGGRQGGGAQEPYNPDAVPRLERNATYSPLAARPVDYAPPGALATAIADPTSTFGPPTPTDSSGAGDSAVVLGPHPPDLVPGDSLLGPPAPSLTTAAAASADSAQSLAETQFGPPIDSALFFGPRVNLDDVEFNRRRLTLLPEAAWWRIAAIDSALGPPTPAYLYAFGSGDFLGPTAPPESLLVQAAAETDEIARQEREAREAARSQRKEAYAEIAASATTQLELAELYRFDLQYPDSALVEYRDVTERYPGSPYAAQALLGMADVYNADLHDSMQADLCLRRILAEYPYSDCASDAMVRLGLENTPADTAHPAHAYKEAEAAYFQDDNPKVAIRKLRAFVEDYPQSRLVPRAEYAIAALTERHFPSTDSSIIWAYQEIVANYPGTELAKAATQKLQPTIHKPRPRAPIMAAKEEGGKAKDAAIQGERAAGEADTDSAQYAGLPRAPRTKVVGQFVWPTSISTNDVGQNYRDYVVYRILIDFTGQIAQHDMIRPTKWQDINDAAERTLRMTTFWADSIPPDSLNMWYKYEIEVTAPAEELDEFRRLGIDQTRPDQSGRQP